VASLFVQAKNAKGQMNTTVVLDEVSSPPLRFLAPQAAEAPSLFQEEYLQRMQTQQKLMDAYVFKKGERVLKEVQVRARKPEPPSPPRTYGQADNVIKMDDKMPHFSNILQALQGRVAGVMVSGDRVSIRGGGSPLFLLDEIPLVPEEGGKVPMIVLGLSPSDVETIEVYKGAKAAIFGVRGAGGVIAIYTRRGFNTADAKRLHHGRITAPLMGYYKTREFYSPKYEIATEEHNLPDLRSTLYWNPRVQTDSSGKTRVSFYNADKVGKLRVRLEGISPGGLPGSRTFVIGP
jgi:hypothetical protein